MSHQSENAERLKIQYVADCRNGNFPSTNGSEPEVWLLIAESMQGPSAQEDYAFASRLRKFGEQLHPSSVVAILTWPENAADIFLKIRDILQYQLFIAVKLSESTQETEGELSRNHATLLILSKYHATLRHTKTRIAYTYCPACDRTTKDYGGKKHTYHRYGTLLSDVWRDITFSFHNSPQDVAERLADLFGLEPYKSIKVVNFTGINSCEQREVISAKALSANSMESSELPSTLLNGDSLDVLRTLPDNSIDFCFADPPYNLAKRYDAWDDAIDATEYLQWCDRWIGELARVLKPGCTCAILNIPILAIEHYRSMMKILSFQSWIAWEGLSLPVRMIMPSHYAILCFSKGEPRQLPGLSSVKYNYSELSALSTLREHYCVRQSCVSSRNRVKISDRESISDLWWDIHRLKHNSRRVNHPCQLPPSLMRRLIALFTYENEIVLDPFNGAGTTTLCAQSLNRRFIGIELSEAYHTIAQSRHDLLRNGRDPFEKVRGIPGSKNSRVQRIGSVKYEIPKKTLQLEVKRVAGIIGKLPTREDIKKLGKYPLRYYDEYFVSWGEVCAAARTTGMTEKKVELDLFERT